MTTHYRLRTTASSLHPILRIRDLPRDLPHIFYFIQFHRRFIIAFSIQRNITILNHVLDHSFKPHLSSVIGTIDLRYTIIMQFFHFRRKNSSTSSTKYFDMTATILNQQVLHVLKEFHMPSLVTGDSNTL